MTLHGIRLSHAPSLSSDVVAPEDHIELLMRMAMHVHGGTRTGHRMWKEMLLLSSFLTTSISDSTSLPWNRLSSTSISYLAYLTNGSMKPLLVQPSRSATTLLRSDNSLRRCQTGWTYYASLFLLCIVKRRTLSIKEGPASLA